MFPGGGRREVQGGNGRKGVEKGGELEGVRREGEGHMGREGTEDTALWGVGKDQPGNVLSYQYLNKTKNIS